MIAINQIGYKLAIIQIGYQKDGATINIYKLYQHSGYNPTIIVASQELRIKKNGLINEQLLNMAR